VKALLLLALLACSCGGGTAPAATPSPSPAGSGANEPVSSDDAGARDAPDGGATPTAAPGEPPPAASSQPTAPEPVDECTPVGVAFEKRARPKLKECYREGKTKEPDLKGTVRITVDVNTLGKITSTKITEKSLPDPVAQCMLKVVKTTPFTEASKCPGKSITIPITFPTPH
jgi:TonB family protein